MKKTSGQMIAAEYRDTRRRFNLRITWQWLERREREREREKLLFPCFAAIIINGRSARWASLLCLSERVHTYLDLGNIYLMTKQYIDAIYLWFIVTKRTGYWRKERENQRKMKYIGTKKIINGEKQARCVRCRVYFYYIILCVF